jgi:hypothetical protein
MDPKLDKIRRSFEQARKSVEIQASIRVNAKVLGKNYFRFFTKRMSEKWGQKNNAPGPPRLERSGELSFF